MTNYKKVDGVYKFRNPLDFIENSLDTLAQLSENHKKSQFKGNTLFVVGTRSNYIKKELFTGLSEWFPNNSISQIQAGHWGNLF